MFLLDTSVVSGIVNPLAPSHLAATNFMNSNQLFLDQVYICVITQSELEFGLHLAKARIPSVDAAVMAEVERRVGEARLLAGPLTVDRHVAAEHARLRSSYAQQIAPRKVAARSLKSKPVELWHDDLPASTLQITENDLWIAAVALTHDFILVHFDTDFTRLQRAEPSLRLLAL